MFTFDELSGKKLANFVDGNIVRMDEYELHGHMTYPDILGKIVGAQAVHQVVNSSFGATGHIGEWGLCVCVGPLGFVLERAETVEILSDPIWRGRITRRRFYPWNSCVVTWEVSREEIHGDSDGECVESGKVEM